MVGSLCVVLGGVAGGPVSARFPGAAQKKNERRKRLPRAPDDDDQFCDRVDAGLGSIGFDRDDPVHCITVAMNGQP